MFESGNGLISSANGAVNITGTSGLSLTGPTGSGNNGNLAATGGAVNITATSGEGHSTEGGAEKAAKRENPGLPIRKQ